MRVLFFCMALSVAIFGKELNILAAANLRLVLEEVKQEFLQDYPDVSINLSFLSSGKAYAQIINGAKADLFFSADEDKPQKLFQQGYVLGEPQVYAFGTLVLCTTKDLNLSTFKVLQSSSVKHIAIANPKLAPYGFAGVEFLKNIGAYADVAHKLVVGDSVGMALSYVKSGNADLGLSALSLVINDKSFTYRVLDDDLYPPIKQAFVVLEQTKNNDIASAFARFVLSSVGQGIFERYGYKRAK
ncbi:molybdate ABC transporter substrate-binding protein [Helicobacter enhydrae]|uniref:Molybdate ABC transporter substrate-binding protein n=1 Tax=Helicobacter enhydrae TaxID=222136 RepID=A0A1B1U4F7_9HELI|nr:molybdate ABC transporter substrate-binding protein [Helicobacter enhydrae]ANV97643.1 molybdate ABC transporter substrate-binding protein [Helicobacter enhydrae]